MILCADSRQALAAMRSESVHCCVTSPPYWGLRAYGGDPRMIGLEPTLDEHLGNLVGVFREVRRVLRRDGTLWLNYGDAYAAKWHGGGSPANPINGRISGPDPDSGMKTKDLMLLPARVALALQLDGWYVRSEIVWHKPNPMPEGVRDRPTSAHEKVFLLSKGPRYYYDAEAVRVADRGTGAGANLRNVWQIPTASFPGAHFATFPPALVEPCILAGTSARGVCGECGAPWVREVERRLRRGQGNPRSHVSGGENGQGWDGVYRGQNEVQTLGWRPSCECNPFRPGRPDVACSHVVPAIVLDPFAGAGTVPLVAQRLGRRSIGIELNRDYARMAQRRLEQDLPVTRRKSREDPEAFALDFTEDSVKTDKQAGHGRRHAGLNERYHG